MPIIKKIETDVQLVYIALILFVVNDKLEVKVFVF